MPEIPTGERRGAHRAHDSGTGVAPVVVVVILAIIAVVLVAGVVNVVRLASSNPESIQGDIVQGDEEDSGEDEPPEEEQDEATEEPVEKTAQVAVLNGSGVSGIAGQYSEDLTDSGWSVVETANYSTADTTSTVYYVDEEFQAQAQLLADELGIPDVEQSDEFTSDLTLVVCSDLATATPESSP